MNENTSDIKLHGGKVMWKQMTSYKRNKYYRTDKRSTYCSTDSKAMFFKHKHHNTTPQ